MPKFIQLLTSESVREIKHLAIIIEKAFRKREEVGIIS